MTTKSTEPVRVTFTEARETLREGVERVVSGLSADNKRDKIGDGQFEWPADGYHVVYGSSKENLRVEIKLTRTK